MELHSSLRRAIFTETGSHPSNQMSVESADKSCSTSTSDWNRLVFLVPSSGDRTYLNRSSHGPLWRKMTIDLWTYVLHVNICHVGLRIFTRRVGLLRLLFMLVESHFITGRTPGLRVLFQSRFLGISLGLIFTETWTPEICSGLVSYWNFISRNIIQIVFIETWSPTNFFV